MTATSTAQRAIRLERLSPSFWGVLLVVALGTIYVVLQVATVTSLSRGQPAMGSPWKATRRLPAPSTAFCYSVVLPTSPIGS